MKITTIGIDLAKSVFQVHGVDQRGKPVVLKRLRRKQMLTYFAQLSPCLVGMEACGGAHYWARKLQAQGHAVKLMAPQFVKPYVKANKTDAADAEAICEAVTRPSMRFVPIKNPCTNGMFGTKRGNLAKCGPCNRPRPLCQDWGSRRTEPSDTGRPGYTDSEESYYQSTSNLGLIAGWWKPVSGHEHHSTEWKNNAQISIGNRGRSHR